MNYSKESIGKRLKTIRCDLGIDQQALSELSGVSVDAITRYENAKNGMGLESAVKIADALGVSLEQLTCRQDYVCKSAVCFGAGSND